LTLLQDWGRGWQAGRSHKKNTYLHHGNAHQHHHLLSDLAPLVVVVVVVVLVVVEWWGDLRIVGSPTDR
jgi:hypothetical protein